MTFYLYLDIVNIWLLLYLVISVCSFSIMSSQRFPNCEKIFLSQKEQLLCGVPPCLWGLGLDRMVKVWQIKKWLVNNEKLFSQTEIAWCVSPRCPDMCQKGREGRGALLMEIQRRERVILVTPAHGGQVAGKVFFQFSLDKTHTDTGQLRFQLSQLTSCQPDFPNDHLFQSKISGS